MKALGGRSIVVASSLALILALALPTWAKGVKLPKCGKMKFPASGQTTAYTADKNNGAGLDTVPDDGTVEAGATLSYVDNGDGTIKDKVTDLTWEKKSDDGTIHDKDTTYTWDNAFAVHVADLNAMSFAGHTDWRLPNMKELQSIVDWEMVTPAVDPVFDTDCAASCTVLICSCTPASGYWSSSTDAGTPTFAWGVDFNAGSVLNPGKSDSLLVRAVRGGCL